MAGSIIYLPNELLEYILECRVLSYKDIINFGSACVKFRSLITNSNSLWKVKFHQRWPGLQNIFERHEEYDWQDQFKNCLALSLTVRQLVAQMSRQFYKKDEISNCELAEFETMMKSHRFAYSFMVSELMTICCDGNMTDNLTQKFYGEKVVRYLRQLHLKEEWHKYIKLPPEEQTLEKGAVLVAQWCQPMVEVSYDSIASQLDEIASQAKRTLLLAHPGHPLFRIPQEKLDYWRNKNIEENQFNATESEQVIRALQQVLFTDLGFHGNNEMYYSAENSYINKVLEDCRGIPITLSIVFESIARRLGVRCEPVSFPAHFLLRWKQNYGSESEPSPCFYIDVFNGGQFLTRKSCPRYNSNGVCPMKGLSMGAATPIQVIERMANNLEVAGRQRTHMNGRGGRLRSALELLNLVNPSDMNCILHLARFYMLYNMDLTELIATITKMQNDLHERGRDQASHIMQMLQVYETHHNINTTPPEIIPKLRQSENVYYAVGMIMRHKQFNYKCVIFGWDPRCLESQDWIRQMGVENLPQQDRQPFYNVLVEDGSTRYAAQENLEVAIGPLQVIDHLEVGRYFCRFAETHYEPNAEKEEEYPEDAYVRQSFIGKYD